VFALRAASAMFTAASLLAFALAGAADIPAGEKVFQKCMQRRRIGLGATKFYCPMLNGLNDRRTETSPGFK
jgi:cytochrome c